MEAAPNTILLLKARYLCKIGFKTSCLFVDIWDTSPQNLHQCNWQVGKKNLLDIDDLYSSMC